MRVPYFCLDCEEGHQNDPMNADEDVCPSCGSVNIVEDTSESDAVPALDEVNWDDGHYEGDMPIGFSNKDILED